MTGREQHGTYSISALIDVQHQGQGECGGGRCRQEVWGRDALRCAGSVGQTKWLECLIISTPLGRRRQAPHPGQMAWLRSMRSTSSCASACICHSSCSASISVRRAICSSIPAVSEVGGVAWRGWRGDVCLCVCVLAGIEHYNAEVVGGTQHCRVNQAPPAVASRPHIS